LILKNYFSTPNHMITLLFSSLLLLFSICANADELTGRVVDVSSGDSITIMDASNTELKVRLSGIDAPEKQQPFGLESKKSLSDLINGKEVTVNWIKRDYHKRVVGKVLLKKVDVNLEQVKRGMAWVFKHFMDDPYSQDQADYMDAQDEAENRHLGLWSQNEPIPPWEYRRHD
jgi:endonuclease YncB( thermonuclease family)